jgi:hypothetical protein
MQYNENVATLTVQADADSNQQTASQESSTLHIAPHGSVFHKCRCFFANMTIWWLTEMHAERKHFIHLRSSLSLVRSDQVGEHLHLSHITSIYIYIYKRKYHSCCNKIYIIYYAYVYYIYIHIRWCDIMCQFPITPCCCCF